MNITLVRRRCGFAMGGAESYCANIALRLRARGHRVLIVADESTLEGIPFERARVSGRGSVLKNLTFFMESRMVLRRLDPSCVYGLSRIKDADFLRISDPLHAAWLDLGYPKGFCPSVLRHLSLRHSLLLWQERMAIRSCKYLITNSNLVKKQLAHYYRVKPEYCFTVYSGVDHERFRPCSTKERKQMRSALGIGREEFAFLFAGSDFRRKGLFCLLQAVSQLNRNVKVLVAGEEKTAEADALCRKLGVEKQIVWLGFRLDMERLYQAADLFCLPTLYDPFANATLEAMACGTPAVTTLLNGASEAVMPVCGDLVIERPEAEALKRALEYFIGLSGFQKRQLREAFLERSMDFSWERHMEQIEDLFGRGCPPSRCSADSQQT